MDARKLTLTASYISDMIGIVSADADRCDELADTATYSDRDEVATAWSDRAHRLTGDMYVLQAAYLIAQGMAADIARSEASEEEATPGENDDDASFLMTAAGIMPRF